MSKTIDGYFIDPDSGTFQWISSILEDELQQVQKAIFKTQEQSETDSLRGRYKQINSLRNKLEQATK